MRESCTEFRLKHDRQKNDGAGPEIFQEPGGRRKFQEMPNDERHPHEHRQAHHHLDRVRPFDEKKNLIKNKGNQEDVDRRHEVGGPYGLDHKDWIPSQRRSARRVAPTSWTRKPRAPSLTAQSAAAIDPSSRSSGGRGVPSR